MYNKGTTFYIIRETGKPDEETIDKTNASTQFLLPNTGSEKIAIECRVLRKKVITTLESEIQ